jgi:hypothetical protein
MKQEFTFERELHFDKGSETKTGIVRISGIRQIDNTSACEFHIPYLLKQKQRSIYGEDSLQAIMLCLRFVRSVIDTAEQVDGMSIWWTEPGDHGGF